MIGFFYGGAGASTQVFGKLSSIDFDAVLDEQHDWSNEVTSNPVEYGAPITDHIIENADKLKLTGTITNSPLHGELAGQYFGGETLIPRIQTAFEAIRTLHKSKDVVVVYTKHAIYTDMVISSINIPRSAAIGEECQFTMELINVRFVSTQIVELPKGISNKKESRPKQASPQKNAGLSQPKTNTKLAADIKAGKYDRDIFGTGLTK